MNLLEFDLDFLIVSEFYFQSITLFSSEGKYNSLLYFVNLFLEEKFKVLKIENPSFHRKNIIAFTI